MLKTLKTAAAAALFAVGMIAAPAQATFITGAATVADGLNPASLPGAGSTTVVSAMPGIDPLSGLAQPCNLDFGPSCPSIALTAPWTFGVPTAGIITLGGRFVFDVTGNSAPVPTSFTCGINSCADALGIAIFGIVHDLTGVLQDTAFTGSLAMTGACVRAASGAAACDGGITGGYTYSLAATGRATVPEPGTLALLGVGLAGLGLSRRRKT